MFCIFVREDYRMGGKDGFRTSRAPILSRPAGDGAIEERSFVAKGAPLDDGQRRGSMAVAAIVTVMSWVRWAALPTLAGAARMGRLEIQMQRQTAYSVGSGSLAALGMTTLCRREIDLG
jgi:hypothetical protein